MVQFKVSPSPIPLQYKLDSPKDSDSVSNRSDSSPVNRSDSSPVNQSASTKTPESVSTLKPSVMTEDKKRHEQMRTELMAETEEYKQKIGLLGVTIKEYGPAVMRLLGHLLTRKDTPESIPGTRAKSDKKNGTRKLQTLFGAKNLLNQSNEKQQKDAVILNSLFKQLKIAENCDNGAMLKADIEETQNKPSRHIFLFLKTIDQKQYVVGFISGSKVKDNENYAKIDYVCPKLVMPPDSKTRWHSSEYRNYFAAYGVLKLLWLNNEKGQKKYQAVKYDHYQYKNSAEVFERIGQIKLDDYATKIMGFKVKKRSEPEASSSDSLSVES